MSDDYDTMPGEQDWCDDEHRKDAMIFTNCNVCGIRLRTENEERMGACEKCMYDPYADLIEANRDELLRVHQEAIRRVRRCLERAQGASTDSTGISVWNHIDVAVAVLNALNTYHPMHCESWCGWPEGSEAK